MRYAWKIAMPGRSNQWGDLKIFKQERNVVFKIINLTVDWNEERIGSCS